MDPLPDFDTFGFGLEHMALAEAEPPCERCGGTGRVGHSTFPYPCPECSPVRSTGHDAGE